MKILYIITKANWGGAQRYVFDLATNAKALGNEVAVAYGEPGILAEKLTAAGIRTVPLPHLARDIDIRGEVAAFFDILHLLESARPDVVHVNSSKGGLALLAARIAGIRRIVFTAHGFAFNEDRPLLTRVLLWFVYALTIYLAHTTVCVSQAVRNDMRFLPFASRKLVVIRNGIEPSAQISTDDARRTLLPHVRAKEWIGSIAELHPTKRLGDLIKAFGELRDRHPDAILVIAGEGQERKELEDLVRALKLDHRVFLLGFREDVHQCLAAFDVFVLPSKSEALAYVLLEAGVAARPVVATRVGGIPEIILHKKTGLLVPPKQPAVLARAIANLLDDTELAARLGENLQVHVRTTFAKSHMIAQTFEQYAVAKRIEE